MQPTVSNVCLTKSKSSRDSDEENTEQKKSKNWSKLRNVVHFIRYLTENILQFSVTRHFTLFCIFRICKSETKQQYQPDPLPSSFSNLYSRNPPDFRVNDIPETQQVKCLHIANFILPSQDPSFQAQKQNIHFAGACFGLLF